jgi:hypothetical protein
MHVAAELDRLGVRSEVIVAALVDEIGLSATEAQEVVQTLRRDAARERRDAPCAGEGSVS